MTRTIFKVRVITKDVFSDMFARFRSIIGGRVKGYERVIQEQLEQLYDEFVTEFPYVKNIKFGTTEILNDGAELIIYGEVSDEEYRKYIEKRKKEWT